MKIVCGQLIRFDTQHYLVPEKAIPLFTEMMREYYNGDQTYTSWHHFYEMFGEYHIKNIYKKKFLMREKEK